MREIGQKLLCQLIQADSLKSIVATCSIVLCNDIHLAPQGMQGNASIIQYYHNYKLLQLIIIIASKCTKN